MRWEKPAILLELGRQMAANAEGLTLDDMAQFAGADRRTAERMRDALWRLFPQMVEWQDGKVKRFRIPSGIDSFMQSPTAEELAALSAAAEALEHQGAAARAKALKGLDVKIRSAIRSADKRRLSPDIEALVRGQTADRKSVV